jgi:hypothetical protein
VEDLNMLRPAVAFVMTLVPGVAAAEVAVDVHLRTPAMRVSVATGPVYTHAPAEVQPPAPSPHHVWIAGAWGRQDGRRVWVPGRWVMPPGPDYVWEPARWVDQGGTVVFYEGHWRQLPPTVVYQPEPVYAPVVIEAPPPSPIVEVQPAAPVMGAVWIPGYWRWHQHRHHWVKGRWSAPRPGYVWVSDRWDRRGDRRWAYQAGYWQRDGRDHDDRGRWGRGDRDRDDDRHDRGRGHRHGHHKHHHR